MLNVNVSIDASTKHLDCENLYNDEFEINRCNTVGLNVEYATHWLV